MRHASRHEHETVERHWLKAVLRRVADILFVARQPVLCSLAMTSDDNATKQRNDVRR